MFTTPKKAFTKLRAHPYLSPLKLFGFAETPTVTPVSSPGGNSIPPSSPFNSRLSTPPTPRKRYGACRGTSPLNPRPLRPVGRGYHRVGMRRTTSRQSLHMRRSIRNLGKTKATRDSQFVGLTRAAFNTANGSRSPLTHEDRIFLQELVNLGAAREITTSLADARAAADRAAELAPLINAERESKAQASLAREKEQQQAFATQREAQVAAEAAAERERVEKTKLQADELFMRQQRQSELRRQRQREEALHRKQQERFADHMRFQRFFQEARHAEELRQQAKKDRLVHECEARRHDEEVARLREEQEAIRRMEEERTRLEQERLAQEQMDAQAFIDATLRFQQEVQERLQREQAARFQAEQEARVWFEAAQQAETAANHARAQCNSRGFGCVDVSMKDPSMRTEMDTSMYIDMDASMRTAAPYSPPSPSPSPSPPPLTDADRFAIYERKWAALKSDVPVLSFELLPWPTLHDASTPQDITEERMVEFFYNPDRPGYENKTQKERSRIELLRWHPDKFLGKVLGKVDAVHRAMVEEAMGQVTRFLVAYSSS